MLKIFETVAQKSLNKEISRKTPTSAVRNRKDKRMKKMVSQKREQQKKDNCKEKWGQHFKSQILHVPFTVSLKESLHLFKKSYFDPVFGIQPGMVSSPTIPTFCVRNLETWELRPLASTVVCRAAFPHGKSSCLRLQEGPESLVTQRELYIFAEWDASHNYVLMTVNN